MELVSSFSGLRRGSLHPSTVEGWQPVEYLSYWIECSAQTNVGSTRVEFYEAEVRVISRA